jgi:hypothetical protein
MGVDPNGTADEAKEDAVKATDVSTELTGEVTERRVERTAKLAAGWQRRGW